MSEKVQQLAEKLGAADVAERRAAADALLQLGEQARDAAAALAAVAGDPDEQVREAAVGALEDLGAPPREQLPRLVALLVSPSPDVAYWAATLLGRLGTAGEPAVRALAQTLDRHPATVARQRAAWALGEIGPAAQAAQVELQKAVASDDPRLARLAQRALDAIRD